jgi:hypothetical protein
MAVRNADLARLLWRHIDGIFMANYERGEIGYDLLGAACPRRLRLRLGRDGGCASPRTEETTGSRRQISVACASGTLAEVHQIFDQDSA